MVSVDGSGRRKALNHWNKTAKGRLVALLGRTGAEIGSFDELLGWASAHGVGLEPTGVVSDRVPGLDLVAESLEPAAV